MYRFIKWVLAQVGLDLRPLRDVEHSLIGLEIRRRKSLSGGERGEIVSATIGGMNVNFFVMNEADVIQKFHRQGSFYEEEELEIIKSRFSGGCFVDVGANVGNHSVFVGTFLGASKIIAVEPNPEAYRILRVNIALNDLSSIITHHPVGLSDQPGRATFQTFQDNLGGTRLDTSSGKGEFSIVTGDSILSGEDVDFIKIDTEGLEIQVLRGLSETIKRCQPPIFVEVEQANKALFISLLEQWNYEILQTYTRYQGVDNYLAVPVAESVQTDS